MGHRLHFLVLADIGRSAGLAMGGVAHKPWRIAVAELALIGKTARPENFARAAEILLRGPHGYEHNRFKIELAKQGGRSRSRRRRAGHLGGRIMSFAQDQSRPLKPVVQLDHRYEGIAKVTGKAPYAADFSDPFSKADLVHAFIVQATIAYAREGADVAINDYPTEESDAKDVAALIQAGRGCRFPFICATRRFASRLPRKRWRGLAGSMCW